MKWFWNLYLTRASDGNQRYASPLLAQDVSGLPPTMLVLAKFDPLFDDGLAYGKNCRIRRCRPTLKFIQQYTFL